MTQTVVSDLSQQVSRHGHDHTVQEEGWSQAMTLDKEGAMRFRSPGLTTGLAVLTMAAVLAGGAVWAAEEEVNNGQDPTKPLTRIDLRYQYQNLPPDDHDNAHIFTPRADKPFALSTRWSLATRIDLPLFLTEAVNPDNLDGDYGLAWVTCSCKGCSSTRRRNGSPGLWARS
jgi:hypothetical protein